MTQARGFQKFNIMSAKKRNNYGTNPSTGKPFRAQWEVIYEYLREKPGRTITQGEATQDFGFTRLAAIIKDIEYRVGVTAARRKIVVPTRYGGKVEVSQYWIER